MREMVQRSVRLASLTAMIVAGQCAAEASAAAPENTADKAPARSVHRRQALVLHLPNKPLGLRVLRLDSLQSLSGLGAALAPLKGLELGHCRLTNAAEQGAAASPAVGGESN